MGLSDLGNAVIIIFIFSLIHLFITLGIQISRIKENWDEYKCNPAVIPFASLFGHDPLETFDKCTRGIQINYMSQIMDPLYYALNTFSDIGSSIMDALESVKAGLNIQDMLGMDALTDLTTRLNTLLTEMNLMFITISDMFGKLGGTVTVLYYVIITGIKTVKAIWLELPGTIIRFIGGTDDPGEYYV